MLTIIFYAALIYVAIKMLLWGIKATWGIAKIIAFVVLLPVLIIGLALAGMFMLALGLSASAGSDYRIGLGGYVYAGAWLDCVNGNNSDNWWIGIDLI